MNKRFFNQQNLTRRLRLLSVLFAMLLMPLGAWAENYPITVAGRQVTDANKGNVLGDDETATVVFTPANNTVSPATPATLTLNGATLDGAIVLQSGLDDLTIHLLGENKIQGADYQNPLAKGIKRENGATTGTLTFTTSEGASGTLFFPDVTTPIEGFSNIVYNNGLEWGCDNYYDNDRKNYCTHAYPGVGTNVALAAFSVFSITKDQPTLTYNELTITYRNDNTLGRVLTLSGFDDETASIDWYSPDDVKIEISGPNSIKYTAGNYRFIGNSQSNISFIKTGTSATLRLYGKGNDMSVLNTPYISGFKNSDNPTIGEGLYVVDVKETRIDPIDNISKDFFDHYITTEAYGLTVKGVRVHNLDGVYTGHKDHILGENDATVTFTPADNTAQTPVPATLTLNGANIEHALSNAIVSDLTTPLYVHLNGTNSIWSGSYLPFEGATGDDANLVFTTTNDAAPGSLTMTSSHADFGKTTFYTGFNEVQYPENSGFLYAKEDESGKVIITQNQSYGLKIAGEALTKDNVSADGTVTGIAAITAGTVKYTPANTTVSPATPATLTLNGAKINGSIETSIDGLVIDLNGKNTITSTTNAIVKSVEAEELDLTFTSTSETVGSLTLVPGNDDVAINGFDITYQNGLLLNPTEPEIGQTAIVVNRLIVGGVAVTDDNAGNIFAGDPTNDGKVSFVDGTLILNGATISGGIIWNWDYPLTIALNGENSITNTTDAAVKGPAYGVPHLYFDKADGATSCKLTLTVGDDVEDIVSGFYIADGYIAENSGLYWIPAIATSVIVSSNPDYVLIENQVVSDGATIQGTDGQGTITFDYGTSTLTFNNVRISLNYQIQTGLPQLTIKLIGNNSINAAGLNELFGALQTTAKLTFVGEDGGNLEMTTGNDNLFENFANGSITWDKVFHWGGGYSHSIAPPHSPILSVNDAGTRAIIAFNENDVFHDDGDLNSTSISPVLKYSFTYADETKNVSNQVYPEGGIELTDAGKLTAFVEMGSVKSDNIVGKYFGAAENPMRLVYEAEPVDFVLAPAIEEGDGIIINGIEANVTYNTGKVSSSTLGRNGAIVSLGYVDANNKTTILLNNSFDMNFDVVPPAPTIGLAGGTYPSTHDPIEITSDGLANTTIKYQWDDGEVKDYPSTGVPFQAGKLKAWVEYTSGNVSLDSDIDSVTYETLPDPGLKFVVGGTVAGEVNYTIGGSSNPTLPTLDNPNNVSVTCTSSDTGVATVATDGTVTPVGVGYTTITATSTATTEYAAGEASYTLNVYKDLSHSSITVEVANVTYNGQAKTPTVTVKDGDKVLMYGEDNGDGTLLYEYKVEYANNTNAASATAETGAPTVTVTAYTDDDYSESHMEVTHYRGSTTKTFTISPMSISTATVSVDATQTYTYTGSEIKPSVSVSIYLTENAENITTLTEGTDYTVTGYANNTNAATATSENAPTITITGKGNFTGTATGTFTIDQANLGDVTIAPIADQTYTGSQITPTDITVTFNGNAVSEDEYTISYGTNINVGEGTVTLTSENKNFSTTSTKGATFTIVAKTLTADMVISVASVTYTGSAVVPELTIRDGELDLVEGSDFTVVYSDNVSAGTNTAKATITGKGNYTGSADKMFTINKAQLTVTPDDKTYNVGDNIELTVSYDGFVDGDDEDVLTTEPTASYGTADITKPGRYEITASGGVAQNYDFVYETGTLTINRVLDVSFASNTWATYCGTENLATPEGLQAYIVTAVGTSAVTTSAIDYIPANTAVLLKDVEGKAASANIVASAYEGETTTFPDNILQGGVAVDVSTITGGTVYVLYKDMFKRATGGTIPANRGYLVVAPSSGNAPELSITIGDDTTGIGTVGCDSVATDNDEWYTLDGQKLQQAPTQKGLYIKNGKKVVINKK